MKEWTFQPGKKDIIMKISILVIERIAYSKEYTLGILYKSNGKKDPIAFTLGRPHPELNSKTTKWVPPGLYPVKFEYSPRFKRKLWEFYDIPDFKEVKIHTGNKASESDGCFLIGLDFSFKTGQIVGGTSKPALEKFHKYAQEIGLTHIEVVG